MVQKVSNFKTAAAYAEAWLNAAKDGNAEDAVFEEVTALKTGIGDVSGLWRVMSAPVESEKAQTDVLSALTKKAKLTKISEQALKLIAEHKRLNLISLILDEFVRLYYLDKGIMKVYVESAVKLSNEQSSKLEKVLQKKLNAPIVVDYQVNPEVLGGLSVRFGSYLIDDTVQNKLVKLEQILAKGN